MYLELVDNSRRVSKGLLVQTSLMDIVYEEYLKVKGTNHC